MQQPFSFVYETSVTGISTYGHFWHVRLPPDTCVLVSKHGDLSLLSLRFIFYNLLLVAEKSCFLLCEVVKNASRKNGKYPMVENVLACSNTSVLSLACSPRNFKSHKNSNWYSLDVMPKSRCFCLLKLIIEGNATKLKPCAQAYQTSTVQQVAFYVDGFSFLNSILPADFS